MRQMICGIKVETFPERFARETRKRERAEMARWLTEKELRKQEEEGRRRQEKNRRLLERMAPALEASKKNLTGIWSIIEHFPRGGVYYMGFPKPNRRHDTRRVTESFPRIRGWRTTQVEDDLNSMEMRKRTLIGNRNGSEKIIEDRSVEKLKQLPRSTRKRIEIRESLEELAAITTMQEEDMAIARLEAELAIREYSEYMTQLELRYARGPKPLETGEDQVDW